MRTPLNVLAPWLMLIATLSPRTLLALEPGDANPRRWLPESCTLVLEVERVKLMVDDGPQAADEARWNRFYRSGIAAIQSQDLDRAESLFCQALEAATSFPMGDIRFAETLDELGLVKYLSGDDEGAEVMQGAATAEMLLTLGPPDEKLAETAEKSCRSSVAAYMVRLGWIFERQGRQGEIELLLQAPYRILERGYVPSDSVRARLDGLISRYLLLEDFAAADWLASLSERLATDL